MFSRQLAEKCESRLESSICQFFYTVALLFSTISVPNLGDTLLEFFSPRDFFFSPEKRNTYDKNTLIMERNHCCIIYYVGDEDCRRLLTIVTITYISH